MKSTWANEQRAGVIVMIGGFPTYLDSGPEYEAAVAAGPAPYAGPSDAVDPTVVATSIEDWRAAMVVSRFQARAAMHLAGILTAVESVVIAADPLTQIAWADAIEFRRTSPTIATIAEALKLTDTALDDLFRAAALIAA